MARDAEWWPLKQGDHLRTWVDLPDGKGVTVCGPVVNLDSWSVHDARPGMGGKLVAECGTLLELRALLLALAYPEGNTPPP